MQKDIIIEVNKKIAPIGNAEGRKNIPVRKKIFPSGIPKQKIYKITMDDPTWEKEHNYFNKIVKKKQLCSFKRDSWINKIFKSIEKKL